MDVARIPRKYIAVVGMWHCREYAVNWRSTRSAAGSVCDAAVIVVPETCLATGRVRHCVGSRAGLVGIGRMTLETHPMPTAWCVWLRRLVVRLVSAQVVSAQNANAAPRMVGPSQPAASNNAVVAVAPSAEPRA